MITFIDAEEYVLGYAKFIRGNSTPLVMESLVNGIDRSYHYRIKDTNSNELFIMVAASSKFILNMVINRLVSDCAGTPTADPIDSDMLDQLVLLADTYRRQNQPPSSVSYRVTSMWELVGNKSQARWQ